MTPRVLRLGLAAVTASVLLSFAPPAASQSRGGGAVDPEVVYRSAVEDLKAGKYAEACPKFAEARRLKPDSTPALQGLAQCFDKWGQTASAWAKYRQLSVELKTGGDSGRAEAASARAEELGKTLSTLQINPGGADTEGLVIRLDKEEVPRAMFGTKMNVDPGAHLLEATAPGYEVWQTSVTVGDKSDAKELKIPTLNRITIAPPPSKPAGPNPALRPAAFAAGGVGVVGLALGGVFGGLALGAKSTLAKECPGNACPAGQPQSDRASASTKALVSTVGFGVGGAALATGIVLFIVSRPPKADEAPVAAAPKTSLLPSFGPDGGRLTLTGSF
jgi:hypothetical protein